MRGICVVALGYHIYGEMAVNLVASLRVVSPDIPIALLYDDSGINTLGDEQLTLFSHRIKVEGAEITISDSKHYQLAKLLVYKYSPFDLTIYIDVDTLWGIRPIERLFDEYEGKDFYVGAHSIYSPNDNKHSILGYTYWCRPAEACHYHQLEYIQQTVSGLFYFRKCDEAKKIFDIAWGVYMDVGTPHFIWANGKPDEYCFNVALSKMGIKLDRNCPIYFDKLNGAADENGMLSNFWGIAIGGHKIKYDLKKIYNKRVQQASDKTGIKTFEAVEKYIAIPARNNEKNAVQL